ncbi:MAG: hypothetical protein HY696_02275 [Deltaproteobacteria bacterium]|nr:hypothetical protein [Deltaproteobacteria bacterium]
MCPIQFARYPRVARATDPVIARFLARRPLLPRQTSAGRESIQWLVGSAGARAIDMVRSSRFAADIQPRLTSGQCDTLQLLVQGRESISLAACLSVFEMLSEVDTDAGTPWAPGTRSPTEIAPTILGEVRCLNPQTCNRLTYLRRMLRGASEAPVTRANAAQALQGIVASTADYVARGVVPLAGQGYEPILSALVLAYEQGNTQFPLDYDLLVALCSLGYFGVLRYTGRAAEALEYPLAVIPFAFEAWRGPLLGDVSLWEFGINDHSAAILGQADITTLRQLCEQSPAGLFRVTRSIRIPDAAGRPRGFGRHALVALRRTLGGYGLTLRDDPVLWPVRDLPGMSPVLAEVLEERNITDIDQLCRHTAARLSAHGMDADQLEEIENAAAAVGRKLGDTAEDIEQA